MSEGVAVIFSIVMSSVAVAAVVIVVLPSLGVDVSVDGKRNGRRSNPNIPSNPNPNPRSGRSNPNIPSNPNPNFGPISPDRMPPEDPGSFEAHYDAKGRIVWLQKHMELQHASNKKWTQDSLKAHTVKKISFLFDKVKPLVRAILDGALGPTSANNLRYWFGNPGSLWLDPNPDVVPICQYVNSLAYNSDGGRWGGTVREQFFIITVPYYENEDEDLEYAVSMGAIYHELGHICDSPMPHDDLFYKKVVAINTLAWQMGITKFEHRNLNMGYGVEYDLDGNRTSGNVDATIPRNI